MTYVRGRLNYRPDWRLRVGIAVGAVVGAGVGVLLAIGIGVVS